MQQFHNLCINIYEFTYKHVKCEPNIFIIKYLYVTISVCRGTLIDGGRAEEEFPLMVALNEIRELAGKRGKN